ncbi:MAG: hypothetical protein PF508_13170 [Spirochaeta sp.]|jgi:hypothetical protein|nr:hypothetical protein [Spirochaeta sp.]
MSGCVSTPPTDRSPTRSSVPAGEATGSSVPAGEEDDRSPGESPVSPIPSAPDPEREEPDPSPNAEGDLPADDFDAGDTPEPWEPPTTVAPDRPDAAQRRLIASWIRERPLRISGQRGRTAPGAQELLYRSYLNQLFADAGIQFEQGAAESTIVLTVTPEFQSDESDRNAYGATTLIAVLRLEGPEVVGTEAHTELHGPLVLSRVSHEDAHLNSLRRIDPTAVRHAITTLRGELADMVAERGVPFSIAPFPDRAAEDVYAVLRSLGIPDERDRVWHLYDSPERIRTEIAELLVGSSYGFLLNPLTREIRFLYNEES